MIKVLIVDDSETEILILRNIFESSPKIQVIGSAKNGKEALRLIPILKPDLITMDIQMPIMNGYEATRCIMEQYPTPIVVISSKLNKDLSNPTFNALAAGALSVIDKPVNITSLGFAAEKQHIINIILGMAEIKVVKQRFRHKLASAQSAQKTLPKRNVKYEMLAVGTSVGGPQALKFIFSKLPKNFSVPILVVQHMTPGFISGFAKSLNDEIEMRVKLAEDFEQLKPGIIYFAPDNYHLTVASSPAGFIARLNPGLPISGFLPSITALLNSVAKVVGEKAVGVLLTGMGEDGAVGLLSLKKAKGHTVIQDKKSAVVFGMGGVAQSMGAVDEVITLECLSDYLIKITA